jgi:hypothetical protein
MKERQNSYNFMALEMVIPMAVLTVFFHFFVVAVRAWGLVRVRPHIPKQTPLSELLPLWQISRDKYIYLTNLTKMTILDLNRYTGSENLLCRS